MHHCNKDNVWQLQRRAVAVTVMTGSDLVPPCRHWWQRSLSRPPPPCRRWRDEAAIAGAPPPPLSLCWASWQAVAGVVVNGGNVSGTAVANGSKQQWGGGQGLRRTAAGAGFLRDVFSENTFTCFLCPRRTIKSVCSSVKIWTFPTHQLPKT